MIPEELKQHCQWVNWREIARGGRPTKVPFQPNGRPAKSTDPKTWNRFEDLSNDPIGFVFSQADPYIGIDLDGCRDPESGMVDQWAKDVIKKLGSYTEVSPSKTGVKIFGCSDTIWTSKNRSDVSGDGYGGKKPGIEIYDHGRYFAVTGSNLQGLRDVVDVSDHFDWLSETFGLQATAFGVEGSDVPSALPVMRRAERYLSKMDASIAGQQGHNACFKAACAMVLGFDLTSDQAFSLLASEFNQRCQPPWSERELRHKVDSASQTPGQRGYLSDALPTEWSKIFVRSGDAPRMEEPEETGVRRKLLRDAAVDHLESVVAGEGGLLETGIPDLDYAIGGGVSLGEMVIVAARPSHGKSAIALQMLHHATSQDMPAIIVSEEMSALALGKRTIQFASDVPNEHWKVKSDDVLTDIESHFSSRKQTLILESCGSVETVVKEVERAVDETSAKIVAVDYVQLLSAKGNSRYEQVTAASQEMRRLASRLNIIVVVLAQLNRAIEDRKKFIPMMSDLKETGQLEQDADVILFGVWPHRINASNPAKEYQFFVAKNRNRGINTSSFKVEFEPERQRLIEESVKFSADESLSEWNRAP